MRVVRVLLLTLKKKEKRKKGNFPPIIPITIKETNYLTTISNFFNYNWLNYQGEKCSKSNNLLKKISK